MMVTLASLVAALVSLVPVAVVLRARAAPDRRLWAVALDVPLAVALDLLLVALLARFVRVDAAALASRAVWIAAAGALWMHRGEGSKWPWRLDRREIATIAIAIAMATLLSLALSRPYSIWDRLWHTPLVASIRGQRIPFRNVFDPREALHYHFSGDLHAAMLQAFSGGVLHASLALSLSHDVMFGLLGATLALLARGLGLGRVPAVGLAPLLALAGPLTLGRDARAPHTDGYSFLNNLTMSFRPHDALAALFFAGFVGAVLARARGRGPARVADTAPALVASAAGLAVSDEASLGLLGLALGAGWLVDPDLIHPRRAAGIAVFAALLAALVVPNLAFGGSLAPGAQKLPMILVPWRAPGYAAPPLPLATAAGRRVMLYDTLPLLALWLGGSLGALLARTRPARAILVLHAVLFACSFAALARVEVNRTPAESHRFMTALSFSTPLLAALVLARRPGRPGAARLAALALVAAGGGLGAASTIDWIRHVAPVTAHRHEYFFTRDDLYAIDCRRDFGARLGEAATPTYLTKSMWYAYAGCRPVFAPAQRGPAKWALTIGVPLFDRAALRALQPIARPDAPLPAICPRSSPERGGDSVCARARGACRDLSARAARCELSPSTRAEAAR